MSQYIVTSAWNCIEIKIGETSIEKAEGKIRKKSKLRLVLIKKISFPRAPEVIFWNFGQTIFSSKDNFWKKKTF